MSEVFPLPAGAEMIVTFRAAARSSAARRSPRSISRRVAGASVTGLSPGIYARHPKRRRRNRGACPLDTSLAHVLSTAPDGVGQPDRVRPSLAAGGSSDEGAV